jgi:hypothetical protein
MEQVIEQVTGVLVLSPRLVNRVCLFYNKAERCRLQLPRWVWSKLGVIWGRLKLASALWRDRGVNSPLDHAGEVALIRDGVRAKPFRLLFIERLTETRLKRQYESLANFAERDAFRSVPKDALEAFYRFAQRLETQPKRLVMHRHDKLRASSGCHLHCLLGRAVRMNPGIVRTD